ncbi:MAG: phospho-N-acetylmuramoyl-pentapeptide-transferase [Candidatus Omnitrophica bacterium]|nr:phospho-N-acetylmuramoyl-pentapeptide-transferase [Candidatus Omnitrophota bacterium]MBI3083980.1 phospho-N-acetylmuramoyl-pentapeptide-transferase [Candidatus Omnitrophota bacterium]
MVDSFSDAAAIFLISAGVCVAAGRVAIPALMRGQRVAPGRYEDCPPLMAYQAMKQGTPTMGGLFVLSAGILVACAAGALSDREGWLVLAAVAGLGAVGLLDDCLKFRGKNGRGLRSLPKLVVALAIGAILGLATVSTPVGASTVEVPWLQQSVAVGWGWVPFAAVVVAGSAHAVNLTDGMDGLASGCVAIALSALGFLALTGDRPHPALVAWCASLAGACVGFLWFNGFPASVFLGDVGALGLGAALGTISLLTRTALWLVIIGGVFVVEALSVVFQVASYKWRGQRRIFRVAPLHHHVHLGGLSEPKLIVRFWIVGILLAALGLTTIRP